MDSYTLAWGVLTIATGVFSAAFFVAFVYVSFRAAGVAWYKSKFEHLRKVLREFGKNGDLL